jgi:hypothetical protein
MMRTFYLPFPFFCMGCCLASSIDVELDDKKRVVRVTAWPGDCFLCYRRSEFAYTDVANVALLSSNVSINHRSAYYSAFFFRNGDPPLKFGAPRIPSIEEFSDVLQIHRFLFGRGGAESRYNQPDISSLCVQ